RASACGRGSWRLRGVPLPARERGRPCSARRRVRRMKSQACGPNLPEVRRVQGSVQSVATTGLYSTTMGTRYARKSVSKSRQFARVRILLVSQMYPGPDDPDLGTFVAQVERALAERGHDVERAVLDRRAGGKRRYLDLARDARGAARRFRPDVVYAHFLVPAGLAAALASRTPLVVTAHGRDVRNIGAVPGVAAATRFVVGRASTVVCVSDYLRRELELKLPAARGKTEVVSSGVDLERFAAATRIGGPPEFVTPEAGILVDPADEEALVDALRAAAALPSPNPAARAAARPHDVRRQAERVEEILRRAARGRRACPRPGAALSP